MGDNIQIISKSKMENYCTEIFNENTIIAINVLSHFQRIARYKSEIKIFKRS